MGQVQLQGALIGGPPSGGEVFPAALFNVPLKLRTDPKGFGAATGILQRTITSAVAYVQLADVGANGTVTQANTLYLKSAGPIDVRLTCDDGVGGNVVSEYQQDGMSLLEFSDVKFLKMVEVRGSAQIEFFASGTR
jgi:hypothetical protein